MLAHYGAPALDWALAGAASGVHTAAIAVSYDVYAGGVKVGAFTNTFGTARAKPVAVSPANGGYVYTARPTFKWRLPQGLADDAYPAFRLEVRQNSVSGPQIYSSGVFKAPPRDIDGVYSWEAPLYANSLSPDGVYVFLSNRVYAWRVAALNAKYDTVAASDWSDATLFRLDVNTEPGTTGGYGAIQARVKYYGPATNLLANHVKVRAFSNPAFSGFPAAEHTLSGADLSALTAGGPPAETNAVLAGLSPDRAYWVMAFLDGNLNGVRDVWESWGYAHPSPRGPPSGVPAPVAAGGVADVVISDADTDQDWFPDAWEYEQPVNSGLSYPAFLVGIGPSAAWTAPDAEINPTLSTD
jgi:hypothetical protein